MSDARAYVRLRFRRLVRTVDLFWVTHAMASGFVVGLFLSLQFVVWGLFMILIGSIFLDSPRRGDTGFSSTPAYLVSRPIARPTVFKWRRSAGLTWAAAILIMFGLGWWLKCAQRSEPPALMSIEPPIAYEAPLAWLFILGTFSVATLSQTLSPFVAVASRHRTTGDSIFVGLAWLAYAAIFVAYFVFWGGTNEPPTLIPSSALWAIAGVALFAVLHTPRISRRYDLVTSRSHTYRWAHHLRRFFQRDARRSPAKSTRGLGVFMTPLRIYPALVWLAWVGFGWLPMIRGDRSLWATVGFPWIFSTGVPIAVIGAFTWTFFYQQGSVSAYVLSRPTTRAKLSRANSLAFGLSGLVAMALLLSVGWYLERDLGPGAFLLPWAWLLFLYAGSVAMSASLASPTFNSSLGLVGGVVLIATTTMAIFVDNLLESWPTPLAPILCTAAAFALGAAVVVVADRHVRNADIG